MDVDDFMEIHNLLGKYGHIMEECSMNDGRWEKLEEVFSEDAVVDLTGISDLNGNPCPVFTGLAAIKDAWAGGVHPWGHHVTNIIVESTTIDTVTCTSKMIAILPDGRSATGVYHDTLARTSQGWRITHRYCMIRPFNAEAPLPIYAPELHLS